jgi:CHRD domain-containing protein
VVPLTAPDASGKASGCVNVARTLVRAILANPGNYYVNVHTTDFPNGAVRGTLTR